MLEKKKTSINILVNHKVRFLKRRKAKSVNMTINDIKVVYFFSCVSIKLPAGFINKKKTKKSLLKGINIFLKKRKTKRINILVKRIVIFLKKRKTKTINWVANHTNNLVEDEKQRLIVYRENYSRMWKTIDWPMFLARQYFF